MSADTPTSWESEQCPFTWVLIDNNGGRQIVIVRAVQHEVVEFREYFVWNDPAWD